MSEVQWNQVAARERDADDGEKVDWDETPLVQGLLTEKRHVESVGANIYKVETPEGLRFFWGSKVLAAKLGTEEIAVGVLVRVECFGLKRSKSGYNYRDFDVAWATPGKSAAAKPEPKPAPELEPPPIEDGDGFPIDDDDPFAA